VPVESSGDLAGMFDASEFAEPANYTPPGGGSATGCSVIVDRGQGRGQFAAGQREIEGSERRLWARAAEVPAIVRGGAFAMLDGAGAPTGEIFTVAGEPKLDQLAALWAVDLLIAD
jgi:hypothetical protein